MVKRLYGEFKPINYDLFIKPNCDKSIFDGQVTIRGQKIGRPSRRITLHQKGLKIKSAKLTYQDKKLGNKPIKLSRINTHRTLDELRLHASETLYPGLYQIEIEFSGKITEPMHGIYPCNFELNGRKKKLIATQFESHHAREAFPCIDEPEAKAAFNLSLLTPPDETVIGNMPIKQQTNQKDMLMTVFEKTPIMSSYLLAFAYGQLDFKKAMTASGIEVRVYSTADKVELTDFALDVAVRCLEFFEDYYGVPYPLKKLDLIGLPDFSAGAMENWGLITFRESVLYVDEQSSSVETKQTVAMVICHELAHQWFGNLVTMKWWNDLWLNESFANLMEYRAVDSLFPKWHIWQDFARREVSMALARDALPNVQPVQVTVNHPDELTAIFDPAIVYAKGGSLLNMVRHLVGDDSFRKGLKSYFLEHKYGNTVADDLWRHIQAASQIPIQEMMQNWLKKPGFPVIEVNYQPKAKQVSLSQQRLVIGLKPQKFQTIWQVPLASSIRSDCSILKTKTASLKLSASTSYPLVLNHDGHSYIVSQYLNQNHFNSILQSVKNGRLSPIDRLLLVQNYLLLERAGRVSTLDNIQLLAAYENELDESVWGMLVGIIGNARTLIDKSEELESKFNDFIRPVVKPLVDRHGWRGTKNDSAQIQKLRALALSLAAAAEDQAVIAKGLSLFKDFNKPSDLAADIRSAVYFIAVRYGGEADFEKLINLYKSLTNADEKDEVASELTSTRQPAKIKRLLSMITTPDVRLQDAPTWFAWLMRNRYATDLAWQWLTQNWKWVEQKYGDDKSYDRFPRYAAMVFSYPDQLKKYEQFFESKSNIALKRPIELGIEEIESRVAWRESNEAAVKQWLSSLK